MGQTTKIDWCDSSWNPVTGCRHGCQYCYARGIANRFGGRDKSLTIRDCGVTVNDGCYEVIDPVPIIRKGKIVSAPYPFGFEPTIHCYKLDEPKHWKKPRTIFVCSMADLFGDWVPTEWIQEVFKACAEAPQHKYLFLTKHPARYERLALDGKLLARKNFWYGTSTPKVNDIAFWSRPSKLHKPYYHTFISIEPILERFGNGGKRGSVALTDWTIIGAETGNRKGKVIPEKGWIMEIAEECKKHGKPIFMKQSLRDIMGEDFRQEFPWEVNAE